MKGSRRLKKVGRNDPCPCGSGKKYKKCCGRLTSTNPLVKDSGPTAQEFKQKLAELQAEQKQREKQQGLGRPIVSTMFKDYRLVAVGSRLYWSKDWKTFHDFLFYYIKTILGSEWGNAELKKPQEDRHPILQWYGLLCETQKQSGFEKGVIKSAVMTGAIAAYLGLAYNLYLLGHNVGIQNVLVRRLKDRDKFPGAFYEAFVAALFIRAGFDLEFENEADGSTSHCEFTATFKPTGNKFSVEAKARRSGKDHFDVGNQLYDALSKEANHARVIFIEINVPDTDLYVDIRDMAFLNESLASIRSREAKLTVSGKPAPAAYVFITNQPHQYCLHDTRFRSVLMAEGYKIPDFKLDVGFSSLRDALRAREKHQEMFQLMKSVQEHQEIPTTFDGEIPEFAYGETSNRLMIGKKYLVPDASGQELVGVLQDAVVNESERVVYGVYNLENGRSIIATSPLSELELEAYRRYPDTFFGVLRQKSQKAQTPLQLFDFFFDVYRNTSRENLLEFMSRWQDYGTLEKLDTNELAIRYCEGLVYSVISSNKPMQPTAEGGG